MGAETAFDELDKECPLTYAPNLLQVLKCSNPPPISFFRTLPEPTNNVTWGVYAMLLEKDDSPARLYVGSGTRVSGSVQARFRDYDKPANHPRLVKCYVQKGCRISHIGLLAWCPVPVAHRVATLRVRMVTIEATFAYIFAACPASSMDYSNTMNHDAASCNMIIRLKLLYFER
jgi:hypothetical protein